AKASPQLHAGAGSRGAHPDARMALCSTGESDKLFALFVRSVKNRIRNVTVRAAGMLTFSLSFPPPSVSDDLKEFFFAMAKEVRKTILGPLSPKCSLLANIKTVLQQMLPEDSYQLASGRLHISLTRVVDGQNVMASEFSSKEELIQALLCSCFLPIYCGFIPPSYRGVRYVDGGFTGLQPVSSLEEAVITVSPFTGELDICPRDCPAIFLCFQIFNGSIQISIENLCRISYALFPPSAMVSYQDTALFLYRNSKCHPKT
uniref:Patatin like phospholipase domain containing 1 n=1 Tax=Buteo japonicus TaxID=224669 RepID=A0A8C0AZD6_9AVES